MATKREDILAQTAINSLNVDEILADLRKTNSLIAIEYLGKYENEIKDIDKAGIALQLAVNKLFSVIPK